MSSLLDELAAFENVMRGMKRKREEEQVEERPVKKARQDIEEATPSVTPAKVHIFLQKRPKLALIQYVIN